VSGEHDDLTALSRQFSGENEQLRDRFRISQRSLEGLRQDLSACAAATPAAPKNWTCCVRPCATRSKN
jgi:hypothetical protein